jgi:hypothetical protein
MVNEQNGPQLVRDDSEYEWFQTIAAEDVPQLVRLLGGDDGSDAIKLLAERYIGDRSHELERIFRESQVPVDFSIRAGCDGVRVTQESQSSSDGVVAHWACDVVTCSDMREK